MKFFFSYLSIKRWNISKYLVNFIFFIICILNSNNIYARWGTESDADIKVISENIDYMVHKDGTSEQITDVRIKLLQEGARGYLTNYRMTYCEASETLEVIEAKTILDGKEYVVDKKLIEDKPLASPPNGFDQKRQISVPFSNIAVGAEVHLITKAKLFKPSIPKQFQYSLVLPEYIESYNYNISSEIDFKYHINDPYDVFDVKNSYDKKNGLYKINIKLKRPLTEFVVNDIKGKLNKNKFTYAILYSYKDWGSIAGYFAPKYNNIANQTLPPSFEKILKKAEKAESTKDKIDIVIAALQDEIQYFGDWQTIDGKLIPRDLNVIADTRYGDCKDFSISTVAILRRLGYEVYAAFVKRGYIINDMSSKDLIYDDFNHAIVYLRDKNGDEYWLDPTNKVTMAGNIFSDIADRPALVLNSVHGDYGYVPNADISSDLFYEKQDVYLVKNDDNILTRNVRNIKVTGESAADFIEYALDYRDNPRAIQEMIYNGLLDYKLPSDQHISSNIPVIDSRIVKDQNFSVEYYDYNSVMLDNIGYRIFLDSDWGMESILNFNKDNERDAYIGTPRVRTNIITIKNAKVPNIEFLNFDLETEWFAIHREGKIVQNDTEIITNVKRYKSYIPNEVIKNDDFQRYLRLIQKRFINKSVVIPYDKCNITNDK